MNILGIDYGSKQIGLARASSDLRIVLPFGVIKNSNQRVALDKIKEVTISENIDKIVIGLPLGLDGTENNNTKRIRMFAGEIRNECGVEIEFISEIFSSHAADRMAGGVSRDEKAAMVILQSYLDKKSGS